MKILLTLLMLAATAPAQNLVGTWRLLGVSEFRPNGEMVLPYGKNPSGLLIYDAQGNMSVQIQYDGKAENGETYLAYFGAYKIDPSMGAVLHVVKGSTRESYRGTTQLRFVTLSGNRLTLGLPPLQVGAETRLRSVSWERVQ
ncbi:MAG: lipocalin-like domain-containing protein [Acidobacteria bacterium]|nr:lipocalin-like domain-containing protein [Acidobacteriota bacterium]